MWLGERSNAKSFREDRTLPLWPQSTAECFGVRATFRPGKAMEVRAIADGADASLVVLSEQHARASSQLLWREHERSRRGDRTRKHI